MDASSKEGAGSRGRRRASVRKGQKGYPNEAPGRGELRLEEVLALSSEWYWEQDERHRFALITGGPLQSAGFDLESLLGVHRWDRGAVPVGDGGSWEPHKAALSRRQPFSDFVYKRVDPSGEVCYISASGQPAFDEQGRFRGYQGIAKDVTQAKRAERLLALEHSVYRGLAEAESVATTLKSVIRSICETEGWECGQYWPLDESAGVLRFGEYWSVPNSKFEAFFEKSRNVVFAPGVGLIGSVLQSGKPLWVADVTSDPRVLRSSIVREIGLHAALVLPQVDLDEKIIGVLAFSSTRIREPDARLLQSISVIGTQIGQFLQHKRVEETLRRFRVAMDNSADMIVLIDRKTMRFVDVNETACKLLGYSREELLTMGPQDVLPTTREELERAYDEFIAQPSQITGMHSFYRRKDGSTFPFESTRHVLQSGDSHLIAAISRDIGMRVAAEEDLLRFRAALDTSADMIMLVDRATMRYIDVNTTACEMQGYAREEMLRMGPQDVAPVSREQLERAYDESIRSGQTTLLRNYHRRKDGTQFPVEVVRRAVRAGERWIIVAIVRDITERERAENLQAIEHAVTRCLAEAVSVGDALKGVMRALCETLGWECGRYFRMDEAAGLFRLTESWYVPNPTLDKFIAYSAQRTFAPGSGIVGRAGLGEPQWVADVTRDVRVVNRQMMASDHGMRGAFMFPVLSGSATLGVLSFTSREIREPDQRLLQAVRVIGAQIGQFLQRKRAEEVVRESEERFRGLTQLSSDMYWEQDDQFRFTSMSGTGSARVNPKTFLAIGKKRWEQNYVNMTADQWAVHIALLEAHKEFRDMELCRLDESGNKIWISISGEPVFDSAGAFKGYRGVGKDITERKHDEEHIHYLANHDALTSLPNRAMFGDVLRLAIENARRYKRKFAVLFIDLDRFKNINDTLGHDAGDKLLQEMAQRLTQTVRGSDVVARLGGDEFVVLVQEVAEAKHVEAVARKILSAANKPMSISGQECRVTGSIGICMYPSEAQDEPSLMKNADIAMYSAKEDGKNNYKFYSEEMNVHSFERLALETSLRRGIERNEFLLHYQAKLDLRSGRITGVEALVRWQHPELGMVPPLQFITLAEDTGLIVPLGRWVLNTACAQNVAWQRAGLPPVCMAVNISPRQFADEDLVADIAGALKNTGLRPELLELEITEGMVIEKPERAGRVLAEIKKLGARLAIDDFGVGYSSLTHLKRFPIDTLKVDRSFIRDLPQDSEDKAITEAIIAMGKSLNLTVVAEGVETIEQQTFLQDHACDEMQGYLFSKPVPSEQFAELLRQRTALSKQ